MVYSRILFFFVCCVGYLKQTSDGLMALVVDWYSLSLANVLFAWRRDTGITSTFVKVMNNYSYHIVHSFIICLHELSSSHL